MPGAPHARGRGRLRGTGRDAVLTLPADLAGRLLAPEQARGFDVGDGTDSAVLVPLYERDGDTHAVFTRRRDDLKRHAGEISFPGGRRDPGETLEACALREAHEEIGLEPGLVEIAGALTPVNTWATGFVIHPFVGVLAAPPEWVLSEAEVAEVLELPLAGLRAGAGMRTMTRRGITFETHVFEVGDAFVWGATARVVADLLERL